MTERYQIVEIVTGDAAGPALVLDEPLSLWGGLDPETGLIIDRHHPQHGHNVAGTMLFMPFGRGSSSASSVLAEAARLRTAPAAFVMNEADEIVTLGALVAHELYGQPLPIVIASTQVTRNVESGQTVRLQSGWLEM